MSVAFELARTAVELSNKHRLDPQQHLHVMALALMNEAWRLGATRRDFEAFIVDNARQLWKELDEEYLESGHYQEDCTDCQPAIKAVLDETKAKLQ